HISQFLLVADKGWDTIAYFEHNLCIKVEGSNDDLWIRARVSTDSQTWDGQEGALRKAGAERIFAGKVTGVKTNQGDLGRCMASLGPGDLILVTKLDRLARSTRDLLNTLAAISDKGASFRSLGDGWADPTTPHGKLMITELGGL